MFYCSSILSMAGMSNQNLGTVIVFAVQFVMTGVACLLMDKLGRRYVRRPARAHELGASAS